MKSKPVTRKEVIRRLEIQLRAEKAKTQLKKALKNFRAKRTERESFVFINTKGQRRPKSSSNKGYMLYVDRSGRVIPQTDPSRVSKVPKFQRKPIAPESHSIRSIKTTGTKHKRAEAKLKLRLMPTKLHPESMHQSRKETEHHQGIDYDRIIQKMGEDICKQLKSHRADVTFMVDVTALVRIKGTNETRPIQFRTEVSKRGTQKLDCRAIKQFVRKVVYKFFASELSKADLVTEGSARYIRRLNPGIRRDEWEDKDGERWEKNEFRVVSIENFQWDLLQVRVGNG